MKQGTNSVFDVNIDYDISLIKHIDFIFKQGNVRKIWEYPSTKAYKDTTTNTIHLVWSYSDTFLFKAGAVMQMDTLIQLNNSTQNPQTQIVRFVMNPTLFTQQEISNELG